MPTLIAAQIDDDDIEHSEHYGVFDSSLQPEIILDEILAEVADKDERGSAPHDEEN